MLDLVLDAVLIEAATPTSSRLLLEDPQHEGCFIERIAQGVGSGPTTASPATLNLDEVLEHFREDRPLLAHGSRALPLLRRAARRSSGWSRFCSIPLKLQDRVIGMLNAY